MQQEVRYEVMVPKCAIQKNNGENFTSQEINVFLDDFCDWLERRGLTMGGSIEGEDQVLKIKE